MSDPLRVLVADDEPLARARLVDLCRDCDAIVTAQAANGEEVLRHLEEANVDVILLDVRMPGMDGMEAARRINALPQPPVIVFVTAYDNFALQAFDLNAAGYLLKPVRRERLKEALARARALLPKAMADLAKAPRRFFSIGEQSRVRLVPVDEVRSLHAEQKYVVLRSAGGEHLLTDSLIRLESEFGERFLRIHRSCLVARAFMSALERDGEQWYVVLDNGERLPVSRRQLPALRAALRPT